MGATQSRPQITPQRDSATPRLSLSAVNVLAIAPQSSIVSGTPSTSSSDTAFSPYGDAATPHFRFLDLPPEIRNMIYAELVVVGKVFYTPDEYDLENGSRYHDHNLFRKPEVQLFRVCIQICCEAESLYLSQNLFVLPIYWYKCRPFNKHRYLWPVEPVNERYVFSSAGLTHVKNVSVAVDQKLVRLRSYAYRDWTGDELDYGHPWTEQRRYEEVHNGHMLHLDEIWDEMIQSLMLIKAGLLYLEVDLTNAYCAIGDCRPIDRLAVAWIRYIKPKAFDILGAQSMEEKQDVISCAKSYRISHRELRHEYGLRFRKPGDNKTWDKFKMEGEPKYEKKHSLQDDQFHIDDDEEV